MRNSDWKITWDPAGAAMVFLDFDDLMDSEIRSSGSQLVTAEKSDFDEIAAIIGRANAKRRLEFSRRITHATAAASWDACTNAFSTAPWRIKAPLKIQSRSGGVWTSAAAALLNSRHRPALDDGLIESVHEYSFRITQPLA